ncbi:hypothetical protein CHUAL_011590 [Chamberlinius hualienensis]
MLIKNIISKLHIGFRNDGRYFAIAAGESRWLHSSKCSSTSKDGYSSNSESESSSDSNNSSDEGEFVDVDNVSEVREKILKAALGHVPKLSWSRLALARGAEDVGLSSTAEGLFSRGEVELVEYFNQTSNHQLVYSLKKLLPTRIPRSELQMKFFYSALQDRLKMIIPLIHTWPKALTLMSHPPNVIYSLKNLHEFVDDVLYHAGDRSADFSWYPKRAGLAAVYVSSELAMMSDKSADYTETWQFLNRRLEDYDCGGKCYETVESTLIKLPDSINGSFTTIRNILGVGNDDRPPVQANRS